MRNLIRRLRLWWASTTLTPQDLACMAWDKGRDLDVTYKHLIKKGHYTRNIAIIGLDLAIRGRN